MFNYEKVDEIVDIIAKEFSPEKIIVFGSVARHEAQDGSDLDLLIVMDTDAPKRKRSSPIYLRLFDLCIEMDLIVVTPEEFESKSRDEYSFINEIVNTGVVAFEA